MLETAYFLISLGRHTPVEVARLVRRIPGITEAVVTMGDFDIIAIAQSDGTKGFRALASEVQRIEGVSRVTACVVVRP